MGSLKRAAAKASEIVTPASDAAAADLGEPSAADATWAAIMIPHHESGIQMARMAATNAATEALRNAAKASVADQESDLPELHKIIRAAGKDPDAAS
ncbi:DUF305 domain-containing protein [Nocardioides sp. SOB77]|uniref:DUF305 domain-containing protein n=1 Tax=Nocardioides oceani TaxID=3058369 RepID=A0ABT8FMH4_9ACTN|nr:DUF305 domain-containing protein [Nocardioides oceani]MDN4175867.1 DUF305 domain-containing protein [Nocardioides oceani]